jgi:hypothetical protein
VVSINGSVSISGGVRSEIAREKEHEKWVAHRVNGAAEMVAVIILIPEAQFHRRLITETVELSQAYSCAEIGRIEINTDIGVFFSEQEKRY